MALEMKVPSPGESITEVEIAAWLVKDGDYVEKDQAIAEVDSDKATLELPAEASGIITLKAEEGDVVGVGEVVCLIDTDAKNLVVMMHPTKRKLPKNPNPRIRKRRRRLQKKPLPKKGKPKNKRRQNHLLPTKSRIRKHTLQVRLHLRPRKFLMKRECLQKM